VAEQGGKSTPEFGRHGVVEERIDGAVGVDGETAAEQEPAALVAPPGERVVDDEDAIGQPERRERRHDDDQHLYDLSVTPANDSRCSQPAASRPTTTGQTVSALYLNCIHGSLSRRAITVRGLGPPRANIHYTLAEAERIC